MQEIRSLSAGLGVPHLKQMTLPETIIRAKKVHEQRSHSRVLLQVEDLPEGASLPVKITVFRFIQEGLNNAFRHAGGKGQEVKAGYNGGQLTIEVSDQGPGFRLDESFDWDRHLGLAGMRERVESLGGVFQVESTPGTGTRVMAFLPLEEMEVRDDWRDTGSLN
jgi:signal transduction histidine kinase